MDVNRNVLQNVLRKPRILIFWLFKNTPACNVSPFFLFLNTLQLHIRVKSPRVFCFCFPLIIVFDE
eukprot:UN24365